MTTDESRLEAAIEVEAWRDLRVVEASRDGDRVIVELPDGQRLRISLRSLPPAEAERSTLPTPKQELPIPKGVLHLSIRSQLPEGVAYEVRTEAHPEWRIYDHKKRGKGPENVLETRVVKGDLVLAVGSPVCFHGGGVYVQSLKYDGERLFNNCRPVSGP